MHPRHNRVGTMLTAALAGTLLSACSDRPPATGPEAPDDAASFGRGHAGDGPFRVYSQNVYLGGDTEPLLSLDFTDVAAVLRATASFWAQVEQSDPAARAAAVVRQMDRHRPHMVGLQEAFDFTVMDLSSGAPTVLRRLDLLQEIEEQIAALGLPYEVVAAQTNTTTGAQSGLPLAFDPESGAVTRLLQFTDRIAVLRRTDVPVLDLVHDSYAAAHPVGPLTLTRGWIRATTEHRGVRKHFITTHLEVQGLAPVQAAQAAELVERVTADLDGVTILAGDLNSDAANPGAPSWTPTYDLLIDAGFTDAWVQSQRARRDPGYTCCQDKDLRNERSSLSERIDFVLVRSARNPSASGYLPGAVDVEMVIDEEADRIEELGLWPSDHAGLISDVRVAYPGR